MSKNVFFFKVLILLGFIAQFNLLVSPLSLVLARPRATLPPVVIEPTPSPTTVTTPTPSPPIFTPTPIPTPTKPPDGGGSPLPYPDVSFLYDGNGVRVAKLNKNGEVTLYAGGMEKSLSTGETIKYYILGGKNVGYKSSLDNKINYLVSDHLSSTRMVVSQEGTILSGANYYPYGKLRNQTGTLPSRQYTNQINDIETNLYFYNARYYNPQTGTFLTADKAQGPNRYAYVGGNPILRNDPSGLIAVEEPEEEPAPSCPLCIVEDIFDDVQLKDDLPEEIKQLRKKGMFQYDQEMYKEAVNHYLFKGAQAEKVEDRIYYFNMARMAMGLMGISISFKDLSNLKVENNPGYKATGLSGGVAGYMKKEMVTNEAELIITENAKNYDPWLFTLLKHEFSHATDPECNTLGIINTDIYGLRDLLDDPTEKSARRELRAYSEADLFLATLGQDHGGYGKALQSFQNYYIQKYQNPIQQWVIERLSPINIPYPY